VTDRPNAWRTGLAALFLLAVAACAGDEHDGRLTADELRALLPGATMEGEIASGGTWRGTYFRDGTMAISTLVDGKADADTGTWHFEDDTVCLTWTRWRGGEPYCLYWAREDSRYAAYFVDGRLSTTFVLVE